MYSVGLPLGVVEFARTWYPSMRYGLAFALMGNGLFERHFSDIPEPVSRPVFSDGNFEKSEFSSWSFWTDIENVSMVELPPEQMDRGPAEEALVLRLALSCSGSSRAAKESQQIHG